MLFIRSPHVMIAHPIFRFELRRVRWSHSSKSLVAYTRWILALTLLTLAAVWSVMLVWHVIVTRRLNYDPRDLVEFSLNAVTLLSAVTVLLSAFLDFSCLGAALPTISQEKLAGRWDLLRLTALNERGIVTAKHAGVRLRVWRFTSIIAGTRLATGVLWLFAVLILPYLLMGANQNVDDLLSEMALDPVSTVVGILVIVVMSLVFIVEPFWRMQALTALGMVISAHVSHAPTARLTALGVMLAVWLLQALVIIALVVGVGLGLGGVLVPFLFVTESTLPAFLFLLVASLITAVTIYGFYAILQTWSLRHVSRRIAKDN